jgi:hypothetical protein
MKMAELETLLARIDGLKTRLDAARPLTSAQVQQALDIEYLSCAPPRPMSSW